PVRVVLRLEGALTALRQHDQLAELALVKVGQPGDVAAGHDEEVPGRVREQVQDDEGGRAAVEHQVLGVMRVGENRAEDAFRSRGGGVDPADVVETPGSPETIHSQKPDARGRKSGGKPRLGPILTPDSWLLASTG